MLFNSIVESKSYQNLNKNFKLKEPTIAICCKKKQEIKQKETEKNKLMIIPRISSHDQIDKQAYGLAYLK